MELTDEMIREALIRYDEIDISRVPNEEDIDFEFSKKFERKMRRLIKRVDTPVRYRLQQAACIAAVLALVLSTYVVTATDVGAQFTGWVKEQYETLIHYFFEGEPSSEVVPENVDYRLSWLPEGYEEREMRKMRTDTVVTYDGIGDDTIYFRYNSISENRSFFFEPDDLKMKPVPIGTQTGELYESDDPEISSIIVWTNDEETMVFSISAYRSEEDLVKMAENVEQYYSE